MTSEKDEDEDDDDDYVDERTRIEFVHITKIQQFSTTLNNSFFTTMISIPGIHHKLSKNLILMKKSLKMH
jgi:hypothetical protein